MDKMIEVTIHCRDCEDSQEIVYLPTIGDVKALEAYLDHHTSDLEIISTDNEEYSK
jgi:hypothetical protein